MHQAQGIRHIIIMHLGKGAGTNFKGACFLDHCLKSMLVHLIFQLQIQLTTAHVLRESPCDIVEIGSATPLLQRSDDVLATAPNISVEKLSVCIFLLKLKKKGEVILIVI